MRRARPAVGVLVAVLGLGLCVGVDAYYVRTDEFGGLNLDGSISPGVDLMMSLPFLVLAVFTLARAISIPGALVGLAGLGAFTGLGYWSILTSDSSTAAIGLAFMPIYGVVAVFLLWGCDSLARAAFRYLRRTGQPRDATS